MSARAILNERMISVANALEVAINAYGKAELGSDEAEDTALMAAAMNARDELFIAAGFLQGKSTGILP